jgi:hypothetical protein
MSKVTGHLKKERKSRRELLRAEEENEKVRRDSDKLRKKKGELVR